MICPVSQETSFRKKTVLLVEDDVDIADILVTLMSDSGYEVEHVGDGIRALETLQRGFTPDLILLDMRMPRMGGLEFLNSISEEIRAKKIPIIVMSASEPKIDDSEFIVRVIRKPMGMDEVLLALEEFCPLDEEDAELAT